MHPIRQRLRRLTHVQWVVLLASFGFVVTLLIWRATRPPEPSYQGKSASAWWAIYLQTTPTYLDHDQEWGDRYEAALAFREMGPDGTAFLVSRAIYAANPDWKDQLAGSLPGTGQKLLHSVGYESTGSRAFNSPSSSWRALEESAPPVDWVMNAISHSLHTTNSSEWTHSLHLLTRLNSATNQLLLSHALQWAASTNRSTRAYGLMALERFAVSHSDEVAPTLIANLGQPGVEYLALRGVIALGEAGRPAIPTFETMRQGPDGGIAIYAASALLRFQPARPELLADFTNAVLHPKINWQLNSSVYSALQRMGTNAIILKPLLISALTNSASASDADRILYALESISKPDAIAIKQQHLQRTITLEELSDLLYEAGRLLRIGPPEARAQALEALELRYDAMLEQSGWEPWRTQIVKATHPDAYDKPPPDELIKFLERIEKDDPDKDPRHAATQALKYFHLRWPK